MKNNSILKKTHILESYTKYELLILKEYLRFCIDNFSQYHNSKVDRFIGFCYGIDKYLEYKKISHVEEIIIKRFLNKFIHKYVFANRTTEYSFYFHSIYERKEFAKQTIKLINKLNK